jgi:DTW domain-containing protein
VCPVHRDVACPLELDVLMHHREQQRPSSTGHLINRVFPASRHHLWRSERGLTADEIRRPGRELWVLHPHGEPVPAGVGAEQIQVVLLDGSWRETAAMLQDVRGWGRAVSLPMHGESRYWLRERSEAGRFSTAEALLFLLRALALGEAHEALRLQFELHVYASLRARGHKLAGLEFRAGSPIIAAFGEFLHQLELPRPR